MRTIILLVLFAVGCNSAIKPTPDPIADSVANYSDDKPDLLPTIKADTDEIKSALTEQTGLLIEIKETLKASLVKSEPKQLGGDPASALRPPAKNANDSQPSTKIVAEPGAASPETLVELATRLYAQGVSVHMKTEEELRSIDAQMKAGQPVTGAIFPNNRASAITSQRNAVRFVPRGSSVIWGQNYSTQSTCGPGGCPAKRSR